MSDRCVEIFSMGDKYGAQCYQCDWGIEAVETLETVGHLAELHEGDEHFDD